MTRLSAGWSRVWISTRARYFLKNVHSSSWPHSASYSVLAGALSLGTKWSGCEVDHLLCLVLRIRTNGALPSLHLYAFMSCMEIVLLCTFFLMVSYFVLYFMFRNLPEISNLPWDSDCTLCIGVNIFLSFFLLIFSIFITHGYRYLSLMMSTMCSFEALHYKPEGLQVQFPMVSEFFIDIILPAARWPWGWLSL